MEERGQITIEALLIVGMFMVLIFTVSYPIVFRTKRSARDVSLIGDARFVTDQITNAANSIIHPDERRKIDVYVPGYDSVDIDIPVNMGTDGDKLITTVALPAGNETLTADLYGTGWKLYTGTTGAELNLTEDSGGRYNITIRWKNITYWRQ